MNQTIFKSNREFVNGKVFFHQNAEKYGFNNTETGLKNFYSALRQVFNDRRLEEIRKDGWSWEKVDRSWIFSRPLSKKKE